MISFQKSQRSKTKNPKILPIELEFEALLRISGYNTICHLQTPRLVIFDETSSMNVWRVYVVKTVLSKEEEMQPHNQQVEGFRLTCRPSSSIRGNRTGRTEGAYCMRARKLCVGNKAFINIFRKKASF